MAAVTVAGPALGRTGDDRAVGIRIAPFGLLGLYVGPVLLAVAYALLDAWVSELPNADIPASVEAAPTAHPPSSDRHSRK